MSSSPRTRSTPGCSAGGNSSGDASARIFAVVDVYDALTSERPYRPAWTGQEALAHIAAGKGTHFAPDVVDALLHLTAPERPAPDGL